jgi:hypothetical protein
MKMQYPIIRLRYFFRNILYEQVFGEFLGMHVRHAGQEQGSVDEFGQIAATTATSRKNLDKRP